MGAARRMPGAPVTTSPSPVAAPTGYAPPAAGGGAPDVVAPAGGAAARALRDEPTAFSFFQAVRLL